MYHLKPIVFPKTEINSCLFNYFPDGTATTPPHQDKKQTDGSSDDVYMICLGQTRMFHFLEKDGSKVRFSVLLTHGMVLQLTPKCNYLYKHVRPKSTTCKKSYSFTFRQI